MLGFQAPPLDACPPACYFPRPLALCHPPVKPWSFTGTLFEPRTLRRTDGRPWAPAPGPEPPALTGWPVAQGERLRRKGVGGKARGMPSESCLLPRVLGYSSPGTSSTQVSVRWGTQQIQLVVDGSQTRSQKAPRHRVHRAEGPQPHTLFVGGLPASSYSSRLPVRTILPHP